MMTDHREKIDTLQALRCLAFLAVFASHTDFRMAVMLGTGRWGVSVFLMLSGFTMVYSYYNRGRVTTISLRDNLHFAIDKIKGLYPLHVVVTLAMMVYLVAGENAVSLGKALAALVLNLLLIQEFLPLSVRSICAVAWYLCTVLVSYICFPWILRWMERRYTRRKAILMIVLSVLIVALLGWIGSMMPSDRTVATPSVWTTDFSNWFIYKCPFVRVWEFFIGCNLGYLYITRITDRDINRGGATVVEALLLLAVAGTMIVFMRCLQPMYQDGILYATQDTWWSKVLLWVLPSMMMVYVYACGNGLVSRGLVNRVTMYLARISATAYLIHFVVLCYFTSVWVRLIPGADNQAFKWTYGGVINLTLGLALTVLACEIWSRMVRRLS